MSWLVYWYRAGKLPVSEDPLIRDANGFHFAALSCNALIMRALGADLASLRAKACEDARSSRRDALSSRDVASFISLARRLDVALQHRENILKRTPLEVSLWKIRLVASNSLVPF